MAKTKPINLNFHQITSVSMDSDSKSKREDAKKAISNSLKNFPNPCRSITRLESRIEMYKGIEEKSGFYLGTLINNQVSGIAAKYHSKTQRLDPLNLGEDEGLGHPVNFLFDPEINIVMMESVRNGVSVNALCGILSANLDLPKLEPAIVINPSKMQEFYNMRYIKSFKVKIARVENGSIFKQKTKRALMQIASSADNTNTDILEYNLGVYKKNDSLNLPFIQQLVRQSLGFKESQEVERLEVVGREEEDGRAETINLIEHALRDKITVEHRRLYGDFAREDRFMQLVDLYRGHKQSLDTVYKLKKA